MATLIQINTTLNSSSTGRIAEQISILAEKHGWNCYIAHGNLFVNKSQIKNIQIGTKFGNYIHAALGEFAGMHGFGSYLATYYFIRKLKKIKPDIVHLHNLHGYYINIELLFKYLSKVNIPVVWTLHDCWSFTGHCTHFDYHGCSKWKTQCYECPLLMAQYKSRFIDRSKTNYIIKKKLYNNLNNLTIVPVSNWLGTLVRQSILKTHAVNVIQNGIDLDIFSPKEANIRSRLNIQHNKKIILGVVSSGFKGKQEFIELSKDERFQVIIVGVQKQWIKDLPDNIICIFRTNNQSELAEYYSAADVYVNPTYNDTFPTTNIESLACGTPVVTYRTGGSPEILSPETGLVVDRGDYKSLIEAILTCCGNGKAFYHDACVKRAHDLFNKDERFMDYIQLYESLLK